MAGCEKGGEAISTPEDGPTGGGGRIDIPYACQAFDVSETCHRYPTEAGEENSRIADWPGRSTDPTPPSNAR
jgi:hypothetical protein